DPDSGADDVACGRRTHRRADRCRAAPIGARIPAPDDRSCRRDRPGARRGRLPDPPLVDAPAEPGALPELRLMQSVKKRKHSLFETKIGTDYFPFPARSRAISSPPGTFTTNVPWQGLV